MHRNPDWRDVAPRPESLRDENPRQGFSAPPEWLRGNAADRAEGRGHYGRGPRGYRRSDDRIREAICDRLTVHEAVDASDMEVHVHDGIVTLAGSVEDRQQKRLAEWIAEDEPGVNDVDNRLEIRRGFWSGAAAERETERRPVREPDVEARRESGMPGGGAGRRDTVGRSGVYPMSGGLPDGRNPEIRTPAAWGQGKRGAAGYEDSGGSELVIRDGQLLGGLTAGPGGEPTIDIHQTRQRSAAGSKRSTTESRAKRKRGGR
jgi:hypothetical protein